MFVYQVLLLPWLLLGFQFASAQSPLNIQHGANCNPPYVLQNGLCVQPVTPQYGSGSNIVVNITPPGCQPSVQPVAPCDPVQPQPCPNQPFNPYPLVQPQPCPNQPVYPNPPVQPKTCPNSVQPQPCPIPVQPQPCPNSVQPQPCPNPVQPQPCPNSVQPQPCPIPVQPQPCPNIVQPPPYSNPVQPQPCPNSVQPQPCPNSVQPQPCPNSVQPQPCPILVQPPPCSNPVQPQPCPNQPFNPYPLVQPQPCPNQPVYPNPPVQPCPNSVQPPPYSNPVQPQPCPYPIVPPQPTEQPPTTPIYTTVSTTTTTMPPPEPIRRCPPGTVLINGNCRFIYCGTGVYSSGRCVMSRCPQGTVWTGQKCAPPYANQLGPIHIERTIVVENPKNMENVVVNNVQNVVVNASLVIPEREDDYEDDYSEETESLPAPAPAPPATKCCTVIAPRICRCPSQSNRWQCYNRRQQHCGDFCSTSRVVLRPSTVSTWYDDDNEMLLMPPNWNSDCRSQGNCNTSPERYDCSGCASGRMTSCSSYCYNYHCNGPNCGFYDQDEFCNSAQFAGFVGCRPEDGWQR